MNENLDCLRHPLSGLPLILEGDKLKTSETESFPIVRGIPRFVGSSNYSSDFGAQWNRFPQTQLDSYTGLKITKKRLARCLRGHLDKLDGQMILEAGSGAGRFTEILLDSGAQVHSFDYSNAVDANARNNGNHKNLVLVQADIREIPFPSSAYDFVVCLGVLQHTPSPESSIEALWEKVKPGGYLVIDHYRWKWRIILPPPIGQALDLYRLLILRLPKEKRFEVVRKLTEFWFPWHWKFRDSWTVTRILRRISPVIFHYPDLILRDKQEYYNWALLDTHDSTTDFYKHYRTPKQLTDLLQQLGAEDIVVTKGGNGIEAFCRKRVNV